MKVLIDSNIIVNYLNDTADRDEDVSLDSLIVRDALFNRFEAYITATMVTDIWYMLAKDIKMRNLELPEDKRISHREANAMASEKIRILLRKIRILTTTGDDITKALENDWKDFEDAVQYYVAKANDVDVIVTRNCKDYRISDIKVLSPISFRSLISNM